jgi:hypothetical protein
MTKRIYALCTNPKVDYLTDGKRYEVIWRVGTSFEVVDDKDIAQFFTWDNKKYATWTRIEETETPQWALDKAAKAAGYIDYETVSRMCMAGSVIRDSIEAHAATLAKYETEPVDPVKTKARELVTECEKAGVGYVRYNSALKAVETALRFPVELTQDMIDRGGASLAEDEVYLLTDNERFKRAYFEAINGAKR